MRPNATRSAPSGEWSRRDVLRLGALAGGAAVARGRAASAEWKAHSAFGRARSCLLVFLAGGPSHLDTFDPKPDAPAEFRGAFRAIATAVPGLRICEHLPRLARLADRFALVRAMQHSDSSHGCATYRTLTGQPYPRDATCAESAARDDHPHIGALAKAAARPGAGAFITTPDRIGAPGPARAGQYAGALGRDFDPWVVGPTPGEPSVSSLSCPEIEVSLAAKAARAARRERRQTAEQYGADRFGRALLLGRRLVEAGTQFVQVNWPPSIDASWDTHADGFTLLEDALLPRLDRALAALLDDLSDSGALGHTLVVVAGEFGRSPRVSAGGGRGHWPAAYSVLVAGAGIAGGCALGATDRIGAGPVDHPAGPGALAATMLFALGVIPPAEAGPSPLQSDAPLVELWP